MAGLCCCCLPCAADVPPHPATQLMWDALCTHTHTPTCQQRKTCCCSCCCAHVRARPTDAVLLTHLSTVTLEHCPRGQLLPLDKHLPLAPPARLVCCARRPVSALLRHQALQREAVHVCLLVGLHHGSRDPGGEGWLAGCCCGAGVAGSVSWHNLSASRTPAEGTGEHQLVASCCWERAVR